MNGVHDMGGMHGMGPVEYEKDEPVFHEPWEARVLPLIRGVMATGRLQGGRSNRPTIESFPALDYLRMSYYERFLTALTERMVANGVVTRAEIESGRPAPGSAKTVPALTPRPYARFSA